MSLVKDPVARAARVTTELQAARLHTELELELGLNDNLPDGWEDQAEQAVSDLESRFGGAEHLRQVDTEGQGTKGWAPSMSSGASDAAHGGRRRRGNASPPQGEGRPRSSAQKGAGAGPSKAPARRASSRVSRRSSGGGWGRAWTRTGVPGAADSATGVLLQLVGMTIGLSLVYVLVQGNGPRAVTIAAGSFARGLQLFLSPVDPLGRGAVTRASSAAANAHDRAQLASQVTPIKAPTIPNLPAGATHAGPYATP